MTSVFNPHIVFKPVGAWLAMLIALLFAFLGAVVMASSPSAATLADAVKIMEKETGQKARPFSTRDFGRDRVSGSYSVLVPEDHAQPLLWKIRKQLPPGVIAFIGTQNSLAEGAVEGAELVIAKASNQFDILRVAATDAVNYDKGTEDLIAKLQRWDEKYGIDIYAAQTDLIQLKLKTIPKDMPAFAQEVYEFCPDIVDQGIGSVEKLAQEIARSKEVYLWWD